VTSLLRALENLVDTWVEFRAWQADWNRTWSPVSYFLAAAILFGLVAVAYFFAGDVWAYLATWGRAAS
jgi:hypothetical protein